MLRIQAESLRFSQRDDFVKAIDRVRELQRQAFESLIDEEVAAHMISGFGAVLTRLTPEQADYINVNIDGPYKPDSYKY